MRLFGFLTFFFFGVLPLISKAQEVAGSINGQFEVSQSGSATYSMPLSVPPGTAGMEPKLSLNYDSHESNGLLGLGWSLSGLSTITRCPTTVAQDGFIDGVDFDANDKLCLDGQKLLVVSGSYLGINSEYRTESETFSKIIASAQLYGNAPDSFVVNTKSGLIYEYAITSDSRVEAQGNNQTLYWRVSRIRDLLGNAMSFAYHEDNVIGESYLLRINYTSNIAQGLAAYNSVRFVYEDRPDNLSGYLSGSRISTTKRLKEINAYKEESLLYGYRLSYDTNPVTFVSRLTQIQECDDSSACLKPTTFQYSNGENGFDTPQNWLTSQNVHLFTYGNNHEQFADFNGDGLTDRIWMPNWNTSYWVSLSTGSGFTQPQQWQGSGAAGGNPSYSDLGRHEHYADFNGDGKTDKIWKPYGQSSIWVALSSGTGLLPAQQWLAPNSAGGNHSFSDNGRVFESHVDLNGDGRADRIWKPYGQGSYWAALSIGNGFTAPTQWLAPNSAGGYPSFSDDGLHEDYADFNGDGLTDRIWKPYGLNSIWVALSTGSSFATPQQWLSAGSAGGFLPLSDHGQHEAHTDLNGDGLTDRVFMAYGQSAYWASLSTGAGFTTPTVWLNANAAGGAPSHSDGGQYESYVDLNGDGKSDRIWKPSGQSSFWVALSTGTSFAPAQQWIGPGAAGGMASFSTNGISESSVDVTGDGLPDRVWIPDGSTNDMWVASKKAPISDQLLKITNGFGAETNITYSSLTNPSVYTKGSGAVYPEMDLNTLSDVVASTSISNGLGSFSDTHYHYTGLRYDQSRKSITGFNLIDITDDETGNISTTYYKQTYPYIGLPYRSEKRLSNGTLVSQKEDTWNYTTTAPGVVFPYASQNVEKSFELDGSLTYTITTTHVFDSYGNQTQSVTTRSDGSSETTVSTYDNDTTNWLLGQLRTSTVTKVGSGTTAPAAVTKRVAFIYQPTTGLLASEVVEPGHTALELVKSYQYDAFGNITQKTVTGVGIQPRTETTVYDSRGQFPVTITNALNQTETRVTDPKFGKVTSLTGPNSITTTWQYDGFGRAILEHRADGTETSTYYELPNINAPPNAAYQVRVSSTGTPDVITYSDELSREIRKEATGFNGQKIFLDKVYDEKGYLTHVSDPYFENGTPKWTVTEYDDLGRAITITQPGNRVTNTDYNGLTTTIVNPLNQTATQTVDVQGFVLSSTDTYGNTLTFKNDSYGNPVEITDPLQNKTYITYDLQGKKTLLNDPDTGITTYTYSALGELLTQTDALNVTTSYAYDLLGRVTQRTSPDGVENWYYDTAPHGVGKLAQVTGLNGYSESYQYDSLGRLFKTSTNVGGKRFVTSQTYDSLGRVDTYVYPSTFTLKNIYNPLGYLSEIRRTDINALVWKPDTFNAKGQLLQQTFGNGLVTNKTYDPNTGYMTAAQTTTVQDLSFVFDALGNLTERQDLKVGAKENFTYDSLNRLKTTTVFGQTPVTINYDSIGNITSRSDVGTYTYGVGAGPHAVTSITGPKANAYIYDAAGNRTSSNDGTITYSASGKPISITKGTKRVEFDLDPQDQRIEERIFTNNTLSERKVYIGSLYESVTKGSKVTNTHYIKGTDGLVAVYTTTAGKQTGTSTGGSGGTSVVIGGVTSTSVTGIISASVAPRYISTMRYLHLDHLGSIQTITDSSGSVVEILSFDPWGQRRDATTWTPASNVTSSIDKGFTGHEHLDEVGLIHMNGRIYDPVIGRFVSADPFIQSPKDLQSYNRYSYVLNNPLSLTDPSGYFFKKLFKSFQSDAQKS